MTTGPDGTDSAAPDGTDSAAPDGTDNAAAPDGTDSAGPDGTDVAAPDGTDNAAPDGTDNAGPDETDAAGPDATGAAAPGRRQGKYAGKVALITGSSRGIGRALALQLAAEGADVVINYRRNAELAESVVAEAKALGGGGIAVQADVESPEEIVRLFDEVDVAYGRLDFFINNAAASAFKKLLDLKTHHLDRSYAMNVRPFVLGAQEAVKLMDQGGRIVAVTSYGSRRGFATYAALGSYKAAVESFIRYMAVEFAGYGINVNGVNGGLIDSDSLEFFYSMPGMAPMEEVLATIPLGRPGTVADMANAIEFLLSPNSAYITGQTIVVDGGMTVAAAPYYAQTTDPISLPERPTRNTFRPDRVSGAEKTVE